MNISYSWLKEYIDLSGKSIEQISEDLTQTGLEVEGVEEKEAVPGGLVGMVLGEVLTCVPHPDADKLKLTTVDIGAEEPSQIVCGAPNVAAGQRVVVATVGAMLYPTGGEPFKIKKAKIRGQVSLGMICAEDELGLGTDHDGIMVLDTDLPNGTPAAEYFQLESDHIFEIGLTPNRADAASHIGVARDLKALYRQPLSWPKVDGFSPDSDARPFTIEVQNTEACPRYVGVTLAGVQVQDSPQWLKNRLLSIGLTPINNVVDVTNFVLHEMGQPLHAFDANQVKGDTIHVRTLPEGTPFTTLDEKERKLAATDLMICDGEDTPLCIAGVFGGISSGVTETTTDVFLECAYFHADWVRRTNLHHGLKTDAGYRYERGTDPELPLYAIKRAALLIKELAGGQIASQVIDVYPKPVEPLRVPVAYRNVNRLMGVELSPTEVHEILQNLDIEVAETSDAGFVAVVPPYRVDVTREADVVEELLRIYGINNIPLSENLGTEYLAKFAKQDTRSLKRTLVGALVGQGFQEILTNSLTKPSYAEAAPFLKAEESVTIANKLSEDLGVMRQSLLFSGLEVLAHNINYKQFSVKCFELGRVYRKQGRGFESYSESMELGIWMTGEQAPASWDRTAGAVAFHDLKAVIDGLWAKFNLPTASLEPIHDDQYSFGLSYQVNGKSVVTLGKVHKSITKLCGVTQEVFYANWDWDLLLKLRSDNIVYREVSRYPEVKRDLSLVLDKSVSFKDIEELARKSERRLLRSIQVFDVYEGDKIDAGKKAYAMTFLLQDDQKTLNDKAIEKTMSRLMEAFERELGAIIRK